MITNVAEWPRVQVRVTDTKGEVTIGGTKTRQVHGEGLVAVRSAALAIVAEAAADLGRALRVEATDPEWTFYLIVSPDGDVEADASRPPRHHTPQPGPAPEPAPVLVVEAPHEPGGLITATRSQRARALLPALMAGAGVVTFAGGWLLHGALTDTPQVVEASSAEVDAAQTTWQERRTDLSQAIEDAGALVAATEGQVSDEATRTALLAQLAAADAFEEAMTDVEPPVIATREDAGITLTPDDEWDPGYTAMTQALTTGAQAVQASHTQWTYDALTTAMQAADGVLAASDGQVTDPGARDALAAAITAGQPLVDAGAEATDASELTAAAEAITAAQGGVEASRAQWVYDALAGAVTAGRPVLDGSAGQVPDNTVRDVLFLALADGQRVLDAGPRGTSPTDTLATRDAVNAATAAVQAATSQPQG